MQRRPGSKYLPFWGNINPGTERVSVRKGDQHKNLRTKVLICFGIINHGINAVVKAKMMDQSPDS
jgi:hypothetical protein